MSDFDGPSAYVERSRRARKAHQCRECRGAIAPSEAYVRCSGVWDGCPDSWPMCATCNDVQVYWYAVAHGDGIEIEPWDIGTMWDSIAFWLEERPFILADRERVRLERVRFLTPVAG